MYLKGISSHVCTVLVFGVANPRYIATLEEKTGLDRRCLNDGYRDKQFISFHVTCTTKYLGGTYFFRGCFI